VTKKARKVKKREKNAPVLGGRRYLTGKKAQNAEGRQQASFREYIVSEDQGTTSAGGQGSSGRLAPAMPFRKRASECSTQKEDSR